MLRYLRIRNFALIEEMEIDFRDGLNLFTGETGAGKSIIIQALDVLLGARAYIEYIRTGAEQADLEAVFSVPKQSPVYGLLSKMGIDEQGEELLITRKISRKGSNQCRINGQLATLTMINEISNYLVDIHGQHEHQSLIEESRHILLLDAFGGKSIKELKTRVSESFNHLNNISAEIDRLEKNRRETARRIDLLKFQKEEIEGAALEPGEEEELYSRRRKLTQAEKLKELMNGILLVLDGEGFGSEGALDGLGKRVNELSSFNDLKEIAEINEKLNEAYYQLEEARLAINRFLEDMDFEPEELEKIETRLDQIFQLKRKYGDSIEEILKYRDEIAAELNDLEFSEEKLEALKQERKRIQKEYTDYARKLSQKRSEAAARLEEQVIQELKELAMPHAVFQVRIQEKEPGSDGTDRVSFYISTNPGEELKPLSRVASGGEISRIMLALKTITARIDEIPVLVFDEIDVGIGGKTAQKVAEKLAFLSRDRQILGITHLPQIAAFADFHYFIMKFSDKNMTRTKIQKLNGEDRVKELARMLEGELTTTSLKHARDILEKAQIKKENLRKVE